MPHEARQSADAWWTTYIVCFRALCTFILVNQNALNRKYPKYPYFHNHIKIEWNYIRMASLDNWMLQFFCITTIQSQGAFACKFCINFA